MIVSLTKTKVKVFNKKNVGNIKFGYNGNHIEIVTQYKYVGTVFSSKSQDIFNSNKSYLAQKGQNALFALNSDIKNSVNHLLPLAAIKMFDVQIRPILEYSNEIWYNGNVTAEYEQIHLAYMKNKLNVKRSSYAKLYMPNLEDFPL